MKLTRWLSTTSIGVALTLLSPAVVAQPSDAAADSSFNAAVSHYAHAENVSLSHARDILLDQAKVNEALSNDGSGYAKSGSVRFESQGQHQEFVIRSTENKFVDAITSIDLSRRSKLRVINAEPFDAEDLEVSDETVLELSASIPNVLGVWVRESDGTLMVDAEALDLPGLAAPSSTLIYPLKCEEPVNVAGYTW